MGMQVGVTGGSDRCERGVIGGSVSVWWECGVAGKSVKMMEER